MRTLAMQGVLVAAVALAATGGPVSDEGQTKSSATISIPVLLNDPSDTTLLGLVNPTSGATVSSVTLASGATASVSGDQISYNPNGNLPTSGSDTFSYITNNGTASVTVAVTPGAEPGGNQTTTAPRDDTATTRPNTDPADPLDVRIDVLRNDPQNSLITSIGTPTNGGTAVLDPSDPALGLQGGNDAVIYTPPAGVTSLTDTFTYTTQGGTATVTVSVSASAAMPVGPPADDNALTGAEQSVTIDVLNNDPRGSRLLRVCDPSLGRPDNGTVEVRGNKLVYTPDPTRSDSPSYNVGICYETNGGTATVSVEVGGIVGAVPQAQIQLQNDTRFPIQFRVISEPGVFFLDCQIAQARGSLDLQQGGRNDTGPADDMLITLEPMSGAGTLCVGLASARSTSIQIEAESLASNNFQTQVTTCPVNILPGATVGIRAEEATYSFFDQPTSIRINCATPVLGTP